MGNKIKYCIIHCSDSRFGNALLIDQWHRAKGWKCIGYNLVILNGNVTKDISNKLFNGLMETGRGFDEDAVISGDEIGAHALGYNSESLGICLIGNSGTFTAMQYSTLKNIMIALRNDYPNIEFIGHSDVDDKKPNCPGFNVKAFAENVFKK